MGILTVGELRAALEGVPDDMPVSVEAVADNDFEFAHAHRAEVQTLWHDPDDFVEDNDLYDHPGDRDEPSLVEEEILCIYVC